MEKEEPKYHILNDGDFTLGKFNRAELEKNHLDYIYGLEWTAKNKLFTKAEMNDYVREVEVVAKACKIDLPENYFYPYNKEFFGLYANRAQGYESGEEVFCALKTFNRVRDFLARKAAETA